MLLKLKWRHGKAKQVIANNGYQTTTIASSYDADVVIGAADYHFIETKLLPEKYRSYTNEYWDKRVMAPSCLLYYIGLNKKLEGVLHHSLFFDSDFEIHGKEIYTSKQWPTDPLFYVCTPSVTDETVAPKGMKICFF